MRARTSKWNLMRACLVRDIFKPVFLVPYDHPIEGKWESPKGAANDQRPRYACVILDTACVVLLSLARAYTAIG